MGLFKKAEPQTIEVMGEELKCPICRNNLFWTRSAQLNTSVATFFNLDWANKSATCFVCSNCTHISWFLGVL
jgi:predicted nucleic-acid-binding Zn-ribbon protein